MGKLVNYIIGAKDTIMNREAIELTMADVMAAVRPAGIDATLAERGSRYGDFSHRARIAQNIQDVMRAEATGWAALAPDQRQALTVIADKIARMLNGDPNYRDNWHDIVGYAKLVDDRLLADEERAALGPELPLNGEQDNG